MKPKIKIITLALLLGAATLTAQHEFSVHGGTGLSTLNYKATVGKRTSGFGGQFGLGYTYFSSPNLGIRTGLDFAFYNSKFKMNSWETRYRTFDMDGDLFEFHSIMSGYEEKQRVAMLQIPIMLQFQRSINEKQQFYAAAGVKIGVPISGKYTNSIAVLENTGTYDYERSTYNEQIFVGFGKFTNIANNSGTLNFFNPTILASVETGIKWRLSNGQSLYTGLYFDYGSNLLLIRDRIYRPLYLYNASNPRDFSTESVTRAGNFINKINPMALGVTVRLSFGNAGQQSREALAEQRLSDERAMRRVRRDETARRVQVVHLPAEIAETDRSAQETQRRDAETGEAPKIRVIGTITDRQTNLPVVATVRVTNNTTGILEQNVHATGTYEITLTVGHDYGLAIKADGFLFKSERIDLRDVRETQNIEQKVEVDKIEVGVQSTLRNTFYKTGASDLSPESTAELQSLVTQLKQKPTLRLEISGHTDNTGSDAINNRLSQARAKAVVDYLVQHGIAADRLTYVGYGSSKPVADNRTEAGRAHNRRTEIKIIGT